MIVKEKELTLDVINMKTEIEIDLDESFLSAKIKLPLMVLLMNM